MDLSCRVAPEANQAPCLTAWHDFPLAPEARGHLVVAGAPDPAEAVRADPVTRGGGWCSLESYPLSFDLPVTPVLQAPQEAGPTGAMGAPVFLVSDSSFVGPISKNDHHESKKIISGRCQCKHHGSRKIASQNCQLELQYEFTAQDIIAPPLWGKRGTTFRFLSNLTTRRNFL